MAREVQGPGSLWAFDPTLTGSDKAGWDLLGQRSCPVPGRWRGGGGRQLGVLGLEKLGRKCLRVDPGRD